MTASFAPFGSTGHEVPGIAQSFMGEIERRNFFTHSPTAAFDNVGKPWDVAEEKDDHNPDENGSQVNLFLHRSSGSFVRQSGENETADQDPRGR